MSYSIKYVISYIEYLILQVKYATLYATHPIFYTKIANIEFVKIQVYKNHEKLDISQIAQTDNTKPRQTIESPKKIMQRLIILDTDLKYLTRVATNINLSYKVQYLTLTTTYMSYQGIDINKNIK